MARMTTTERIRRARERSSDSANAVVAATRRLEEALGACANGVPIRPMDPDDSLATSLEDARTDAVDLLQTSRSRRALRARTGG